jgi:transposase-like protein
LSEQTKYRNGTAQPKLQIVLAGLRRGRSVWKLCQEHAVSETLFFTAGGQLLEARREWLAGKEERRGRA